MTRPVTRALAAHRRNKVPPLYIDQRRGKMPPREADPFRGYEGSGRMLLPSSR